MVLSTRPVIAVDLDGVVAEYNEAFLEKIIEVISLTRGNLTHMGRNCEYWRDYTQRDRGTDTIIRFPESIRQLYQTSCCHRWEHEHYLPSTWKWAEHCFGAEIVAKAWEFVDGSNFWADRQPLEPWVQLVKNLSQDYMIYFVTNRRATDACVAQTHQWLVNQGFTEPNVLFSREGYKGWAVGAIGASIFIDDYYKNCVDVLRAMGTTCKVLVKDTPYNRVNSETYGAESPYIHRIFTMEDFFNATGLDIEKYCPANAGNYGREARRLWESQTASRAERTSRRSQPSVPEWDGEVRQEQLASGDGLDAVLGCSGEASGEMVGGGGESSGFGSASPSTCSGELTDVAPVYSVESRRRRSRPIGRLTHVPGYDIYTDETGEQFTGMYLQAIGIGREERNRRLEV